MSVYPKFKISISLRLSWFVKKKTWGGFLVNAHLHSDKYTVLHQNGMFFCIQKMRIFLQINMPFYTKTNPPRKEFVFLSWKMTITNNCPMNNLKISKEIDAVILLRKKKLCLLIHIFYFCKYIHLPICGCSKHDICVWVWTVQVCV